MSQGSVWTGTEIQEEVILMNESVIKNQGESRAGRILHHREAGRKQGQTRDPRFCIFSLGRPEMRGSLLGSSNDNDCRSAWRGRVQRVVPVVE